MSNLDFLPSMLSSFGFNEGYRDIITIIDDYPKYNIGVSSIGTIHPDFIFPSETIDFVFNQEVVTEPRLAGASAEPNNFLVNPLSFKINTIFPLMSPITGWINPVFAKLWKMAYLGFWGMPTYVKGTIQSPIAGGSGQSTIYNISDFINLPFPVNAFIEDGILSEPIILTTANKTTEVITFSNPTINSHVNANTTIKVRILSGTEPLEDPTFAIASTIHGLAMPCLVNKIEINAKSEEPVKITIEFVVLNIYGNRQIDIFNQYNALINTRAKEVATRLVYSNTIKVSEYTSGLPTGTFGLPLYINGMPFIGTFEGFKINNNSIQSMNITIDNQLKEIITINSNKTQEERFAENITPWAYYSEGRNITGNIVFKEPIFPMAFTQKIAGPSSVNGGGMIIDFQSFKITLDELIWKPGTDNRPLNQTNRTLEWKYATDFLVHMPLLKFSKIS